WRINSRSAVFVSHVQGYQSCFETPAEPRRISGRHGFRIAVGRQQHLSDGGPVGSETYNVRSHSQHGTVNRTEHLFGHRSEHQFLNTFASMCPQDQEINLVASGHIGDHLPNVASMNGDFTWQTFQKSAKNLCR